MTMEMLNLDLNWEEYGLPKAKESVDYNLPPYIKGSGRKPSSKARRIKQTRNYKKRNKTLVEKEARSWADYKGIPFEEVLNSYPRCMTSGSIHPYSSPKHIKWYKKSAQTENERKFAKREIKNYPNDILTFEDEYLYPLKRNYFDKGDYYLCTDNIHAHMNKNFKAKCSTPVKEVLFNCLLNS